MPTQTYGVQSGWCPCHDFPIKGPPASRTTATFTHQYREPLVHCMQTVSCSLAHRCANVDPFGNSMYPRQILFWLAQSRVSSYTKNAAQRGVVETLPTPAVNGATHVSWR